jgi:hypothetical protein
MEGYGQNVMRVVFGCEREEITRRWTHTYNGDLNDVCCSSGAVMIGRSRCSVWCSAERATSIHTGTVMNSMM